MWIHLDRYADFTLLHTCSTIVFLSRSGNRLKCDRSSIMTEVVQFQTFDEMTSVLAENVPHALVQDWWARLEAVVRKMCAQRGAGSRKNISNLIDTHLSKHPAVSAGLIVELHKMRDLRN